MSNQINQIANRKSVKRKLHELEDENKERKKLPNQIQLSNQIKKQQNDQQQKIRKVSNSSVRTGNETNNQINNQASDVYTRQTNDLFIYNRNCKEDNLVNKTKKIKCQSNNLISQFDHQNDNLINRSINNESLKQILDQNAVQSIENSIENSNQNVIQNAEANTIENTTQQSIQSMPQSIQTTYLIPDQIKHRKPLNQNQLVMSNRKIVQFTSFKAFTQKELNDKQTDCLINNSTIGLNHRTNVDTSVASIDFHQNLMVDSNLRSTSNAANSNANNYLDSNANTNLNINLSPTIAQNSSIELKANNQFQITSPNLEKKHLSDKCCKINNKSTDLLDSRLENEMTNHNAKFNKPTNNSIPIKEYNALAAKNSLSTKESQQTVHNNLESSQQNSELNTLSNGRLHSKLEAVQATLEMKQLWNEFNELQTEMIVTKAGR